MTATAARRDAHRSWLALRYLTENLVAFALICWLVLVAVVAAIIAGISTFGTIESSVWQHATGAVPWFAVAMGVQVFYVYLPQHVTHGMTRRDFMRQATAFMPLYAALLAVLTTLGFIIENFAYRVADWSHRINEDRLFDTGTQVHLILTQYFLLCLVWMVLAGMVAAGFYRSDDVGFLTIPVALVLVSLPGLAMEWRFGPSTLTRLFADLDDSVPLALLLCAVAVAAGLAITSAVVRTLPIRTKST